MKTKPTHTPTPWKTYYGMGRWGIDSDGTPICDMNLSPLDKETKAANAAFIVRAVNCHTEFVRQFEALRDHPKTLGYEGIKRVCQMMIDKAEGK